FGLAPGTCVNNSSDEPDMRPRPRYPGEVVRDFGPKYTHTHDGIPFWKPGPGSPGYDRSKVNPDGSMGPILRAPPPPVFDRNGRLIKPSPTTEEWAAQSGQVIPLHGASGASAPPMGDKEKEKSQAGFSTPPPSQGAEKRVDDEDEDDKKQQPKKQKPKKDTRTKAERRIDEEMGREGPFMSEEEYQEDPNFDYEAAEASLFGPGAAAKVGVLPTQQSEEAKKPGEDEDDDEDDDEDENDKKNQPQREGPTGKALEALREQFSRQIRERKLERDIENEVISPQERARRLKVVMLSVKYKVPSPMRGPNNEIFPDIPPEVRRKYGVPEEEYFSKEWEPGGKNAPS
ncbi:MAG: hypothetical protein JWR19_700, partial [Pedosphaera sp.]|nr:hypothetical protein [Pedosphaera sp.]